MTDGVRTRDTWSHNARRTRFFPRNSQIQRVRTGQKNAPSGPGFRTGSGNPKHFLFEFAGKAAPVALSPGSDVRRVPPDVQDVVAEHIGEAYRLALTGDTRALEPLAQAARALDEGTRRIA